MNKTFFFITVLLINGFLLKAQTNQIFQNITLKIDDKEYSLKENSIFTEGNNKIYFEYNDEDEVCEVNLQLNDNRIPQLIPSGDYEIIDSIRQIEVGSLKFKIRFRNLTKSDFMKFTFAFEDSIFENKLHEIHLFPFTKTTVRFYPQDDELYIGEEKIFELVSDNIQNIEDILDWQHSNGIDYRLSIKSGQLRIHLLPKSLGLKNMEIQLKTKKPIIDSLGNINYNLPLIVSKFWIKQSRLRFLDVDQNEITQDENAGKEGFEIQMDYLPGLSLEKTYRVENQEEKGGPLIAELHTKTLLTNNKVLCILRTYNYHRESEGYLYIKEGDNAKFITNFSITSKTTVKDISILKNGVDWSSNLTVYPGEVIDLQVQGEALHKAKFQWEQVENLSTDSALRNENIMYFKLQVPVGVTKRKIQLFNHGEPTGHSLSVKEFNEARDFDFISINYGNGDKTINNIAGPVIHNKSVKDVLIDFNRNIIDGKDKFYGKQYLKIDIKITGRNNELIEMKTIDKVVVVPGEKSPRYLYYDKKDETNTAVSLNKYLRKKTYEIEDWAKIEITFQNLKEKHSGNSFEKTIELYIQKDVSFDIDVSFPAGLLINTFGAEDGSSQYQSFGGISMAMIAQFSFNDENRPGKYKPYRIGAGFLAINAFNLSSTSDEDVGRDMSIVLLGSIYPTRKDVKLTFPLYLGGGYMLNQGKWFVLLGPGIRVRL